VQPMVIFCWKVSLTSLARPFKSVRLPLVGWPLSPGVKARTARGFVRSEATAKSRTPPSARAPNSAWNPRGGLFLPGSSLRMTQDLRWVPNANKKAAAFSA